MYRGFAMSKTAAIVTILIIAIICLLGYYLKESYRNPNMSQTQPTNLTAFDFQNWHEFTSPTEDFKVLFPSLPQRATESVDDPKTKEKRKYEMYVAQKDDGTLFMISLIKFPENDPQGNETVLSEMMNDMVASNPNNKLMMHETVDYKGHPALLFSIANGNMTIDAKSFIISGTLYVLTRIAKTENYTRDEFLFFVNSFELTPNDKLNAKEKPAVPAAPKTTEPAPTK